MLISIFKKYKYKKQLKFWKQLSSWMRACKVDALELELELRIWEGDHYMIPSVEFHYIKILNNEIIQSLVDEWKRPLILLDNYFINFIKINNTYLIKLSDINNLIDK